MYRHPEGALRKWQSMRKIRYCLGDCVLSWGYSKAQKGKECRQIGVLMAENHDGYRAVCEKGTANTSPALEKPKIDKRKKSTAADLNTIK